MKTAELSDIRKNIMGTTSFDMKAAGMRKPQDFIVYPIAGDDEGREIRIQSDSRMGRINLETGEGVLSAHHSRPGFAHLEIDISNGKAKEFNLSNLDRQALRMQIFTSSGDEVGNKVVKTDNSGAVKVL